MNVEQIRQQVQDENTAPEILAELAKNEDKLTRQYVTANPNTPTKTLLILGREFSIEFLSNPIIDLLLLENLDLVDEIKKIISIAAANKKTPHQILKKIIEYKDLEIRANLASNPKLSWCLINILAKDRRVLVRANLARNPKISQHLIQRFAKNKHILVQQGLAENPKIPIKLLVKLSKSTNKRVRSKIAKNINTPKNVLLKLADDKKVEVRYQIILRIDINEQIILTLLSRTLKEIEKGKNRQKDRSIISNLKKHPKTNKNIIDKLNFALDKNENLYKKLTASY